MNISTPYFISIIFLFLVGACMGSFLNLAIYRIPLELSVVKPRSHCTTCNKTIPVFALIPIFSFFILLGRCFFCKEKISWRYPFIEFICGLATCMLFIKFFNEPKFIHLLYQKEHSYKVFIPFLTALWLFYTGLVLSFIDLKYRILPDVITIPGIFVGIFLGTFNEHLGFTNALFGAVSGFLELYVVTNIYEIFRKRQGMGFGDVKYLAFLGAVVGPVGIIYTLLLACILGSCIGIIYGIFTKQGLSTSIPFGPFLAIAAFCVYLVQI